MSVITLRRARRAALALGVALAFAPALPAQGHRQQELRLRMAGNGFQDLPRLLFGHGRAGGKQPPGVGQRGVERADGVGNRGRSLGFEVPDQAAGPAALSIWARLSSLRRE